MEIGTKKSKKRSGRTTLYYLQDLSEKLHRKRRKGSVRLVRSPITYEKQNKAREGPVIFSESDRNNVWHTEANHLGLGK
jgi:hypothetical protein